MPETVQERHGLETHLFQLNGVVVVRQPTPVVVLVVLEVRRSKVGQRARFRYRGSDRLTENADCVFKLLALIAVFQQQLVDALGQQFRHPLTLEVSSQ